VVAVKRLVAAVLLPLLLVAGLLLAVVGGAFPAGACLMDLGNQRDARLDAAQVANARIIVGVSHQLRLPPRAAVIAVATARQESGLRNLPYGDRDSLGLFQQRPSTGWGTPAQILDPIYASRSFYSQLVQLPGWQQLPLTVAAQAVQRSAFPNAYAPWELLATRVVAGLTGHATTAPFCQQDHLAAVADPGSGGYPPEVMGRDGLTPRTRGVLVAVVQAFGVTDIGGYCPGGCRDGHIAGSDHYTGHAIDVMLTSMTEQNRALGDRIATWLVANHQRLVIKYVIWYSQIWSARRASEGWRPYTHPSGAGGATLAHRDHVHVSVY
jgi:hypothetical protein